MSPHFSRYSIKGASTIRYRPHIDGLRGIAVIAVVLYHAKILGVTGGFIGVDVFFVLSGFLITSIIDRDIQAKTFSLLGFWERRIRRILPALIVMMCCTLVASYFFILYPSDFHHFGNAVMSQSLFVSNILFMFTDTYFDQPSRYSPLLHTWSLSVEEQFYLLFPLLILACVWLAKRYSAAPGTDSGSRWNGRRGVLLCVIALGIASFACNVWAVHIVPGSAFTVSLPSLGIFWSTSMATAGFYLLPTRAWELSIGIFIALTAVEIRSARIAEAIAYAGIASVIASFFLFNDGTPFPGVAALMPTLGAAAFIVSNERHRTGAGRLLSYSPLVWMGLISYSLYLWHWPLFVFARTALPPLSAAAMTCLIGAAVGIAWISYRFVETPFRRKVLAPSRRAAYIFGIGALALTLLAGLAIVRLSDKATYRIPQAAQQVLLADKGNSGSYCFQLPGDAPENGLCRIGARNNAAGPEFVVWGDSHAGALAPLFDSLGRNYGMQGVVFQEDSCLPITGVHQVPPVGGCEDQKRAAIKYIVSDTHVKKIFLIARWSYYVMGGPNKVRVAFITDSNNIATSPDDAQKVFERNLGAMVSQMVRDGREVYIVEQVPEQTEFDPRVAFYDAVRTQETIRTSGVTVKDHEAYQRLTNSAIESLTQLPGVHAIDPAAILCKSGLCALAEDGTLLYRDENHVSTFGAMELEPLFAPLFNKAGSSTQ